jgi:hypothetical protein
VSVWNGPPLRATWTVDNADNLRSFVEDVGQRLVDDMAREINAEIDLWLMRELRTQAELNSVPRFIVHDDVTLVMPAVRYRRFERAEHVHDWRQQGF